MKSANPKRKIPVINDPAKIIRLALNGEVKVREEILLQATAKYFSVPKLPAKPE